MIDEVTSLKILGKRPEIVSIDLTSERGKVKQNEDSKIEVIRLILAQATRSILTLRLYRD
jgi:hypothetical protein